MFTMYLHTTYHMPSSSGSLVIVLGLKGKYVLHAVTMLFYVLHIIN